MGHTDTATVSITITPVNDNPPVADAAAGILGAFHQNVTRYEELRAGRLGHLHVKDIQVDTPRAYLEVRPLGEGCEYLTGHEFDELVAGHLGHDPTTTRDASRASMRVAASGAPPGSLKRPVDGSSPSCPHPLSQ